MCIFGAKQLVFVMEAIQEQATLQTINERRKSDPSSFTVNQWIGLDNKTDAANAVTIETERR